MEYHEYSLHQNDESDLTYTQFIATDPELIKFYKPTARHLYLGVSSEPSPESAAKQEQIVINLIDEYRTDRQTAYVAAGICIAGMYRNMEALYDI